MRSPFAKDFAFHSARFRRMSIGVLLACCVAYESAHAQSRDIAIGVGVVDGKIIGRDVVLRRGASIAGAFQWAGCQALRGYWSAEAMRLSGDSAGVPIARGAVRASSVLRIQSSQLSKAVRPYLFGSGDILMALMLDGGPSLGFGGGAGLSHRSGMFAEAALMKLAGDPSRLASIRVGISMRIGATRVTLTCVEP